MNNDPPTTRTIAERIEELRSLYHRELLKPAPYKDCRGIIGDPKGAHRYLNPDLGTYTDEISSFALGAKRVLTDATDYLLAREARLSQTFFERYPQYADLEKLVTKEDAPNLYEELQSHERARLLLLELIQAVLGSRGDAE